MTKNIEDKAMDKVTGGAVDLTSVRTSLESVTSKPANPVPPPAGTGGGSTSTMPTGTQPVDMEPGH